MLNKILIVDDVHEIVSLLTHRLKAKEYETFAAHDGYQCIKIAIEVKPDLILLDLEMPAGGGVTAFEKLKSSVYTSTIPIIFITAYPEEEVKNLLWKWVQTGFCQNPLILLSY